MGRKMLTDVKYVNLISNRVQKFVKKGDNLWNFRCPICGDSKRDRNKARGFVYARQNNLFYRCHNCSASMSFSNFLRTIDPLLYQEYSLEMFKENKVSETPGTYKSKTVLQPDISKFQKPKFIKYTELNNIKKISQLQPEHPAKKYVVKRKIPSPFHSRLFYVPKFKKWVNTLVPHKFDNIEVDEPRLIIPLVDRYENLFGFQGRSFTSIGQRYITIILDKEQPKVYGLERVDYTKNVYVFEGPIDSMFISNSLAMIGSSAELSRLPLNKTHTTVVFDNEPRNKEIVASIDKYIDQGYRVCIWPDHIEQKDVNDMVLAGLNPVDIKMIIDNNTYSDLSAKMRLTMWKKV